jgi:CMP/dCMP kinase
VRAGLVVAIDGPSGAGKSTAGRALAARLGYTFVDTGAMYRALALKALRAGHDLADADGLARMLHDSRIELRDGGHAVRLDGEDVTLAVRSREVSVAASRVSTHPPVRREMVARQRELGRDGRVVLDGRDIGSAVFPDADVKFYVDAAPGRRAERRLRELELAGSPADLAAIEREIRERDTADMTRPDSPLVRAKGAILLDTTELGPDEVIERMLRAVDAAQAKAPRPTSP